MSESSAPPPGDPGQYRRIAEQLQSVAREVPLAWGLLEAGRHRALSALHGLAGDREGRLRVVARGRLPQAVWRARPPVEEYDALHEAARARTHTALNAALAALHRDREAMTEHARQQKAAPQHAAPEHDSPQRRSPGAQS